MKRSLLLALVLAAGFGLFAAPHPAAACSCVTMDMAETAARDPNFAVFVGVPGEPVADVLPMSVKTWYLGPASAPGVVQIEGWFSEEGGGADCSIRAPTPGQALIVATYGNPETGRFAMNLCTLQAPLDSPEGRDLLAEASKVFGTPEPATPESNRAGFALPSWAPLGGLLGVIAIGSVLAFVGGQRRRTRS